VHVPTARSAIPFTSLLRWEWRVARVLRAIESEHGLDVVEFPSHHPEALLYAFSRRKAAVCVRVHEGKKPVELRRLWRDPKDALREALCWLGMARADAIIPFSDSIRELCVRFMGSARQALKILTILIGCRGEAKHPFSWVYLPSPEQGPANRVTHLGGYSPANAPPDTHSLMAEITYRLGEEPDHADAVFATITGMGRAGLLDTDAIVHTATATCEHAYHLMDLGFEERREALMNYLRSRSIIPLGRFDSLQYVNIDQAVEQVLNWVETVPPAHRA